MTAPTEASEWARRQLNARLGEYVAGLRLASQAGRHRILGTTFREANALVDLVAVAESFCVARLTLAGAVNEINTWEKRRKAWQTLGVDVRGCTPWDVLMGFVDARNAIQHGLGKLTNQQLGRFRHQIFGQLAIAGIHRNGDVIFVGTQDVHRCERTCADFVITLDAAAGSIPSQTRT